MASEFSPTVDDRNPVDVLADEFAARLRNGESPSMQEYIDRYPEHASEIEELFPGVALLEQLSQKQESEASSRQRPRQHSLPAGHRFGDIEIVRELGRGGMGIVYEAYQHSLSRAVAVKAIHTGSVHSAHQAARFQREAQAAAQLHHTNIVPVFGVGEQEGTSYYVMQLIHGQGLDAVLSELARKLRTGHGSLWVGARAGGGTAARTDSTASMDSFSARELAEILVSGKLSESSMRSGSAAALRSRTDRDPTAALHAAEASEHPTESFSDESESGSELECRQEDRTEDRTADVGASETPPQSVRSSLELRDESVSPVSVRSSLVLRDLSLAGESFQPTDGARRLSGDEGADAALNQLGLRYWRNIARIGVQVASGLQYAHTQGTLHRDIKPANILLDTEGTAWIADFGLAKVLQQEDVTRTGDVVGTLRYMAPEQFRGATDGRSDLYSLGLTLYEMLTLRPAYEETDRQKLIAQKLTPHDPPHPRNLHPGIPRDLETIVLKCLAWEPDGRYPTASALAADLQAFLDDRPIQARRISSAERFWRWCRRNPMIAGLSTAVAVLLLMHASLMTYGYFREKDRAEREANLSAQAQESARENEQLADVLLDALNRIYEKSVPDRFAGPVEASTDSEDETGLEAESTAPVLSTQTAAMLEEMLVTFDQIANIRGEDARYLEETATANRKVGDLHLRLGQYQEAADAFRRAIERYRKLQELRGLDTTTAVHLARVHNGLGISQQYRREPGEAWESLGRSLAILNSPEIDKSAAAVRRETAATYYLLGRHHRGGPPPRRRGPERSSGADRAEAAEKRERSEPSGSSSPNAIAAPAEASARGDRRSGDESATSVARPPLADAASPPAPPTPFPVSAVVVRDEGRVRREREEGREGRGERRGPGWGLRDNYRNLQKAVAILEHLIEEYPAVSEYRFLDALCHIELSNPWILPNGVSGDDNLDRAIEILTELVSQNPDEPDYLYQLSEAHEQRYFRWKRSFWPLFRQQYAGFPERGDMAEIETAEQDLEKAVALSSTLMRQQPNVARYAEANRSLLFNLADVKVTRGKTEEARRLLVELDQLQQMIGARFAEAGRWHWQGYQDLLKTEVQLRSGEQSQAIEQLQNVVAQTRPTETEEDEGRQFFRREFRRIVFSMLAEAEQQRGNLAAADEARRHAEQLRSSLRGRSGSSSADDRSPGATN